MGLSWHASALLQLLKLLNNKQYKIIFKISGVFCTKFESLSAIQKKSNKSKNIKL